ncbi:acyl carrier protein, partial [Saccharopolyspora kobensis]|uniref:acyl carrier protein n=1 Tax=Saccharopolyspora kobensis TaxID=146035 RepID=UPI00331AFC65
RLRRDRGIDVTVARLLEAGSVRSLIAELTKAAESTGAQESTDARTTGFNGSSSSKVAGRGDASLNGRSSARPVEVVAPVAPVERAVVPERVVAEEVASSNGKSSGGGDLAEYVVGQLARILGVGVDRVDQGRRMNQLGMDSLMLADLRTRLRRDRGIDVTVARLLEAGSVRSLIAELTKAGESTS